MELIKIKNFSCACVSNDASRRVVYMIYPQVNGFDEKWLKQQAVACKCSIVVVYVPLDKWNDCLTPWPEPGETPDAEPFAGKGSEFLDTLQNEILPKAEEALSVAKVAERDLLGVSLGGLFTLWQWMQCDTFRSIACLSGSFWYMNFMDWFAKHTIPQKPGKAFFLLGTEEPKARIKAYRTVGVNTEAIVSALKNAGIATSFDWVPGNHFSNPLQRAEKGLHGLVQ